MADPETMIGKVMVRLVEVSHSQTLQEWKFDSLSTISIGRSPDHEIVIPDSRISRLHVVLQFHDGQWWLLSFGQNGVWIDGQNVDECSLGHGATFRLGKQGPVFEFSCDFVGPAGQLSNTAPEFRIESAQPIQLDQDKLRQDVHQIVDGEFFQKLLDKASDFRKTGVDE